MWVTAPPGRKREEKEWKDLVEEGLKIDGNDDQT